MNTTARLPKISVLLLGAGRGKRMCGASKTFAEIQGITLFERAAANFKPFADEMLIGVQKKDLGMAQKIIGNQNIIILAGGQTRAETIRILLDNASFSHILLHDVARPFVSEELIRKILTASLKYPAVALCTPFLRRDALVVAKRNIIRDLLPNRHVYKVQTPIMCTKKIIVKSLEKRSSEGPLPESIINVLFRWGCKVHLIEGSEDNIKITYPEDLKKAERIACKYTGPT
ncbi:MAG: 2-C-methyl-D-erythritol 4-phosphate cytidylyltransferase [Candidatus Xenobiia bacterium LiM19]